MKLRTTLLLTLLTIPIFVQGQSAKEIVKASYRKMSGGKELNSFKLEVRYDTLRKTPDEFSKLDTIPEFIRLALENLPDSLRPKFESELKKGAQHLYDTGWSLLRNRVTTTYADLSSQKLAEVILTPNAWRGKIDTSRTVYPLTKGVYSAGSHRNLLWLLQHLKSDSVLLDYNGTVWVDGRLQHTIKVVKSLNKREILIDAQTLLPSRIIDSHVDTDPLIGVGPVHYKNIYMLSGYKKIKGFLLPTRIDEVTTGSPFITRNLLTWANLNDRFENSVFAPEPTLEEKLRYNRIKLSDHLSIIEETGGYSDRIVLLRSTSDGTLQLFISPCYIEIANTKMASAIKKQFPDFKTESIFLTEPLTSVSSLVLLCEKESRLHTPGSNSGEGEFYNPKEDSTWIEQRSRNRIEIFSETLNARGVVAIPVFTKYSCYAYYLPDEKVVYLDARKKKMLTSDFRLQPVEIELHRRIISDKLNVEKIIYSDPGSDSSSKFLEFAEFDLLIKNSKQDTRKKFPGN